VGYEYGHCKELDKDTARIAMNEAQIDKIHRRQVARILDHLSKTGQLTPELASDIKRSYGFAFEDVKSAIKQGNDKEKNDDAEERTEDRFNR
jgi:hypothetical protein